MTQQGKNMDKDTEAHIRHKVKMSKHSIGNGYASHLGSFLVGKTDYDCAHNANRTGHAQGYVM